MPTKLRLEVERSLEVSFARLSPRYGCGLMLQRLPRYDESDALINVMGNYGYKKLAADRPASGTISNPGLLKSFYENAFEHKTPLRRNFHRVFGEKEVYLAFDPRAKSAWFIAEPANRMALVNYFRDAISLGLKSLGVMLVGSTPRLTPLGWQNLHDLLSDEFFVRHSAVSRVEVMSTIAGARWREPCLGLGVTMLNLRELVQIRSTVDACLRGESREDG